MSTSNIKDILSSRRRMVAAAAWMLVLVAALSAATYAWFSNSRFTNVTPVAHTVSDEGSDLQIGLSANGPWDTTATLAAADKTLYPISTADLSRFYRGTFQNAAGITTDYADCAAQLDDYALSGTLYLKGSDSALNVYLYQGQMSVTNDPQLLAVLRLGLVITTQSGTQTHIFTCDDLGNTSGWTYTADPARAISAYSMDGTGDTPAARAGATPICTLAANEVASVRYVVYMEGCDANCIDEAQARDVVLQLAFAAAKA